MCLFESENVKSVYVDEHDGKTHVYVLGAHGSWNETFDWATVVVSRKDGKFVRIVRHAQSVSVCDVKRVEVSKCGAVMLWV